MADGKFDLPDDLLSSTSKALGGNDGDILMMGLLDVARDPGASDSSIPLSPQWLYTKPNDTKMDQRTPNALSLGNASDPNLKESDKKDWRKGAPEPGRWREEERETGLLGRRDKRKTDRRVENVANKETGDGRPLASSDRRHDISNRVSMHETRRDSKWSSRWGPEEKEKEAWSEKKSDQMERVTVGLEDTRDNQNALSGNRVTVEREQEARDKWRPRHRVELNSGAPTPQRAAPGFVVEKGRNECSYTGFTVGRGRSNSVPHVKPPLGSPFDSDPLDKNESAPGKPSCSADAFRYPRGKLLDIYRLHKLDPVFSTMPDIEEVPSIIQTKVVEPFAFVAPDADEEAILKDIWKGKVASSGASYDALRKSSEAETAAEISELHLTEGKMSSQPYVITCETVHNAQDGVNGVPNQAKERKSEQEECKVPGLESDESLLSVPHLGNIMQADSSNSEMNQKKAAENWLSGDSGQAKSSMFNISERASLDISMKLPDDSTSLFVSSSLEDSQSGNLLYSQSRNVSSQFGDGVPPEELSMFYLDPQEEIQGPFLGVDIISWFEQGFFDTNLPVRLADAPEGAPFQRLGNIMPHLKVRDGLGNCSDVGSTFDQYAEAWGGKSETCVGASATSTEDRDLSPLVDQSWNVPHYNNLSSQQVHSRLPEDDLSLQLDGKIFQEPCAQDEEIVFPGRPGSGGSAIMEPVRCIDVNLGTSASSNSKEFNEPRATSQSDDKLHPFGLLWSELEGNQPRQSQSLNMASSINMPGHPLASHIHRRTGPFGGVSDVNVTEEKWSDLYRNANMYEDAIDAHRLTHMEQNPGRELAEQLISRQLQHQQQLELELQQRNIMSQLPHLNDSALEQLPSRNLIHQRMANQPLPDIEHLLALQQQQRQLELQQQHLQQQQLHQQQMLMQDQQSQARQLLLEQLLHGPMHDAGFPQSHIDPSGVNSALDKLLLEQHLVQELQQRSQRHSDPYVDQLLHSKLGQGNHQDNMFEMMGHSRHEQLRLESQMLQQEQLRARQLAMGLRQRPDEQLAFGPLDVFQQQQRPVHEEQLSQFERNMQLQERLKRELYDQGAHSFERSMSVAAGGPGMNLDMLNAMARIQGLDIQDPNVHRHATGQVGNFSSGTYSHHSRHPLVPGDFPAGHLDAMVDGHQSNDWMESHIHQLHLNAMQQKRESQMKLKSEDYDLWASASVDEEKSKQLLMELLHQKSCHQSSQPSDMNDKACFKRVPSDIFSGSSSAELMLKLGSGGEVGLNTAVAAASYAPISVEQRELSNQQAGVFDSRRSPILLNSGFSGINEASQSMYMNPNMVGKPYADVQSSQAEGKSVHRIEGIVKGTGSEIQQNVAKQAGTPTLGGAEISTNAINRKNSLGISDTSASLYDEEAVNHRSRVPALYSRGSENILLKRPPVSRASSAQGGLSKITPDSVTQGKSPSIFSSDGARPDVGLNAGNSTLDASSTRKKEMPFRQTSSFSDADASETSFIDIIKNNAKKPPQPESHSESTDAQSGRSGKKKGKKGRQIDPALLGFKVTSNRIMMGEIQRVDD